MVFRTSGGKRTSLTRNCILAHADMNLRRTNEFQSRENIGADEARIGAEFGARNEFPVRGSLPIQTSSKSSDDHRFRSLTRVTGDVGHDIQKRDTAVNGGFSAFP